MEHGKAIYINACTNMCFADFKYQYVVIYYIVYKQYGCRSNEDSAQFVDYV